MEIVTELDGKNFDSLVSQPDKLTFVEFWKDECEPCERFSPVLDEAASRYGDEITIARYRIDGPGEILERYSVESVPRLIAFSAGRVVGWINGYRELSELLSSIDMFLGVARRRQPA